MAHVLINKVWVPDGEPVSWPLGVPLRLVSGETAVAREHRKTDRADVAGRDRTKYALWEVWGELTTG